MFLADPPFVGANSEVRPYKRVPKSSGPLFCLVANNKFCAHMGGFG